MLLSFCAYSQSGEKVELVQANSLEGIRINGEEVRKLIGNVVFKQVGVMLYCDSAYQYASKNELECYGNVRLTQGDTVTLTGNKMKYNGNTKRAVVTENVVMRDRQMTLTTDYLDYDTKNKLASYLDSGKIIDAENTLTSIKGYYSTASKIFWFKKDVKIVNSKENYTLTSDTLQYNSITKIATFRGPSKIVKKDETIFAHQGEYDTVKARSRFTGRAKVESGDYILEGDRLYYDEIKKVGVAEVNVKLTSKSNSIVIFGDLANYWGATGVVKVSGNPLMKNKMGKDTLQLIADTLISIDRKNAKDTTIKEKFLYAFYNVKIYKTDMQAKCDSLVYNIIDSTIYFFRNPIIWNGKNQITADSMNILLKNNKIDKMNANVNTFIISIDSVNHYNQVRGKKMTAFFKDEKLSRVNINGNGQSIYFALDDAKGKKLIGMNKADCSNIVIKFTGDELRNITYITKPDAQFIPPHEIQEPDKKLKGFKWRGSERVKKEDMTNRRVIF